jgi:uncharacterized protein affecting Mg2+/Co2+ transport
MRVRVPLDEASRNFPHSLCFSSDEHTAVQILGRQYTFESDKGQRIALPRNSPGIVGNTPVLAPGDTFEYASGVDIDSPRGTVTGCLHALRRPVEPRDRHAARAGNTWTPPPAGDSRRV